MGISIGAPLHLRTWNLEGGSYTEDFERYVKEDSSNRASVSEGLHEGDLEGGLLYWGPQVMLRLWKCVSASILDLHLGNMERRFWGIWRGAFS